MPWRDRERSGRSGRPGGEVDEGGTVGHPTVWNPGRSLVSYRGEQGETVTGDTKTSKGTQAAIAAGISAIIIGAAVALAILSGGGSDSGVSESSATTVASDTPASVPTTVDYANYETPEELLAGHVGTPLVINFFASWCAPCRAELPDLAAAHAEFGSEVDFVGVNFQEISEQAAAQLLFETGITYPIMEDPDGRLLQELAGLPTMPTTIFVTADGEILERHHGLILSDQLVERIGEIVAAS